MKPEIFQDAMTLLPEELLTPVDALRRRKRFPLKSVLATAACLCLVAGLALGYAKIVAPASAENTAPDLVPPEAENASQSKAEAPSLVEVVQIEEDHIFVVNANSNSSDSCALRAPIKITFEKISILPAFEVGQRLLIYWDSADYDSTEHMITPYRIEIAEE